MKQAIKNINILAIETSCDETAAAIICGCHSELDSESSGSRIKCGMTDWGRPVILSSVVSSQVDIHKKTGGVVPEVAARAHIESILPVIKEALLRSNVISTPASQCGVNSVEKSINRSFGFAQDDKNTMSDITHIAVTVGPGLIGSLLVGVNTAKALSYYLGIPIIPVNHIEGHVYSALTQSESQKNGFPILALTVSGGHTSLTLMKDHGVYETIGQTVDDAAGEAFDKVAKLLGLGYPGGPAVSKLAEEFRNKISNLQFSISNQGSMINSQNENVKFKNGVISTPASQCGVNSVEKSIRNRSFGFAQDDSSKSTPPIVFPRPMMRDGTFNFSFSGLKTAVLHEVRKYSSSESSSRPACRQGREVLDSSRQARTISWRSAVAAAFEDAVVDVLVTKTLKAAEKYQPKSVILAGGVAANKRLREELSRRLQSQNSGPKAHQPLAEKVKNNVIASNYEERGNLAIQKIASAEGPRNDKATIQQFDNVELLVPPIEFCGDNAAMIGLAAYYHIMRGDTKNWDQIEVDSNLEL